MSERPDTSTTTTPANDDMSLAVSHVPTNIDMTPVSSHTHIDIPNVGTVGLPQELAEDHSAIAQKIHNAISSVPRPSVNMEPVVTPSDFNPFAEVGEGVKQVGNLLEAGQEKTEREGGFADIPIYSSVPGSAAMQKQGNISGDFLNKSYKNISVPLAKAGNDFVGSLETPSNFALMGGLSAIPAATETGKALHTAINSYFAGNMSIAGVQNAFEAYKQAMKGNVPEAVQQAANTFLNLAFAAESGKGASETYKAAKEQVSERVKKQVADQQEQKFLEELKQKRANPISVQIPGVKEPIIVPEDKAEAIAKVIHDHVNGTPETKQTVGSAEVAKSDNELFQQAKQELGPNASISQIALRAQELKTQAQKAGTAPTYGSQNKVITTDQYNEAKKTLGDALSGLATGEAGTAQAKFDPKALKAAANIGMYHLEAGARNFKDWSKTMIADLGKDIKPYLNDMWDNMSKKHWPTMAIASHENTGGSTFNAVTGKNLIGSNTYTLGTEPGRTQVINRPLTEQDLKDFANKNADKVKKDSDHYAVGSWKDENGVTHLDVSQKFKSEKEAQQVGRENRQLAMYHLGGKGEVPINYPVTEAIKKDYGVDNNNPAQTGFITVNGDFVPIGYDLHDVAVMRGIDKSGVKGGPKELKGSDAREWFMNQEGAVRLRLRRSPAGWELAISAPDKLRPEQVDRIKQAITKMGPNPNIYVERLPDPKNKDLVPDYRRVEQAKPDDAEKALRELGVYESTKPIEENSKSESPLNATAEALGGKKAVDPISLLRPEEKARLTPSAQNKLRAEFRRLQGSIPEQAAAFTKSAAEAAKEKVAKMREENTSFDFGANVEETLGGKKKNK